MYHRCWSWLPRFYLKALEVGVLACIIGVGVGFLGSISRLQRQGSQHVSQVLELASQVLSQGSRGRGPSMYHRCWSWLPRFYLKALEVRSPSMYHRCWRWLPRFYLKALEVGVLACIIGVGVGFLGSISRLQRQGVLACIIDIGVGFPRFYLKALELGVPSMYHRCWSWLPRFYLKALVVGVLACIIDVGVGFQGSISRLQRQGSQHVSYILELASQVLSQGSRGRGPSMYKRCWSWLPRFYLQGSRGRSPSMYHRCWSWLPRFYLKALEVGVLACIIGVGVGFLGSISRLQRQGSQHVSQVLELASQVLSQGSRGRGPSMYHRCWSWLPRFYLKALELGVLACIIDVGVGYLGSISRLQRQGSQHVSYILELASQVLSQGSRGRGPSTYHRCWSWLPRVLSQGSRGRGPSMYHRYWRWLPRFYLKALELGVLACIMDVGVGLPRFYLKALKVEVLAFIRDVDVGFLGSISRFSLTYISCLSDHGQEEMVKSIIQYL